jgi:hypothetical protein
MATKMILSSGGFHPELDGVPAFAVIPGEGWEELLPAIERVDMGSVRKPMNKSEKAILARIGKVMAKPRTAKSAR